MIPATRAKNVPTLPEIVTISRRLLMGSWTGVTTTLPVPCSYPFLAASTRAAEIADAGSPGRNTTPASAAASAARCMRRLLVQYHDRSMTAAASIANRSIAPAKITMTWPREPRGLAGGDSSVAVSARTDAIIVR